MNATFDVNDHTITAGWATYHKRIKARQRLCGRIFGHVLPPEPVPPNGYSPSNYARCERCGVSLGWFAIGQHRFGSLWREASA